MNELVSIITPSFNTAKYISETIQSVLDQTYTNWEMIIVDDASTDDTDMIVASFNDDRIRYFKHKINMGAAVCRNEAIKAAKGRFIAFLDSDDYWHPEKLEKQIAFMEKENSAFSYTYYTEVDDDGNFLNKIIKGPKKITKRQMFDYCWPGCLTVIYDKTVVGDVSIPTLKKRNDYALWLKICKKSVCKLLPETLACYRIRTGSLSNKGYAHLIKYQYLMFKISENKNPISSAIHTARNMFWGTIKKSYYVQSATIDDIPDNLIRTRQRETVAEAVTENV